VLNTKSNTHRGTAGCLITSLQSTFGGPEPPSLPRIPVFVSSTRVRSTVEDRCF
jgi:hypothetical protein